MAGLKLYFSVSHRQSKGTFSGSWKPSLDCYDNQAILNVEGKSYNVTNCELANMGDRGVQWDDKKEVFFQLDMDDGRSLVGYTENRQGFSTFMKQWRLMKRNVKAEARAKAQAEKEAARATKESERSAAKASSQGGKNQTSTVETAKALKALKELVDAGIITQDEYETKRQALIEQL